MSTKYFHIQKSFIAKILSTIILILIFSVVILESSCKKMVIVEAPVTSLSQANVYNTDVAAISVLTGMYFQLSHSNLLSGDRGISLLSGLSSDEYTLSNQVSNNDTKHFYYIDSLYSNTKGSMGIDYWAQFYTYIFQCNSAIEGLNNSTSLTVSVQHQLLGEAKFIRAFLYFYLVNLYGDIPLILTTDWHTNAQFQRTGSIIVYQQIINDLLSAQSQLSSAYLDANLQIYTSVSERVRPTKWAATALLARAYLYTADYANAEAQATAIINNTTQFGLPELQAAFLKNSSEAIWQIQPVFSGQNTSDALLFLIPSTGPGSEFPVYLSPQLLSAFEMGDQRRYNTNWVDSVIVGSIVYYYPYKYKAGFDGTITDISQLSEYLTILRLGEQFLIRAEARVLQNNIAGAQSDLNVIRTRAGLGNITEYEQESLLKAILHERQVELFSELGHRWLDLKRTGNVDAVLSVVRPLKANGGTWKSYMQLYPISFDDIQKSNNLRQNPGYE